ncbi:MAG TPA: flagellar filament capping protein FliD [Candidatus Limnocylindrales bacterium]|nr:flagellar filament capping protein FliD [Candidatus Limnocylindrales bacterium]
MSSSVTLSGFNNIDFGSIVSAILTQERRPEIALQQRQLLLKSQSTNLSTLATKLAALDTAATALANPTSLAGRSVSNTNSAAVSFSAGATTPLGSYDIVVNELARAQVTPTTSTAPDTDTTAVATGGTLTIDGVTVTISAATTLQDLADAINATDDIGVTASVVQSGSSSYKLVLTGNETGEDNTFAITNSLTGGTGVTFGTNATEAADASITLNNVVAQSSTNTFTDAVTGATFTVLKKDTTETVTVTVNQDASAGKTLIGTFVSAYNDLVAFAQSQRAAANTNDSGSLGHDAALRTIDSTLRQTLGGANTADSTLQYLADVGVGFSRTGQLTFDEGDFETAAANGGLEHMQALFSGSGGVDGVFEEVRDTLRLYNASDGPVAIGKTTRTEEVANLDRRIADFEARLKIREDDLRRQFAAADQAMSRLNAHIGALSALGGQYRLF